MYGLIALNFIIPFVMVFVGYILKKHPVKDMTSGNGYNTPTSRKSQEHWDYAQSIAPNIFIGIGKTLGLVEIVLCISLLLLNISTQTTVFAGVVVGIIFLIFAAFYILDSLYLYVKRVKKNGSLKLFPVHIFLIPVILGVVIQAFFVEIAITWTSIAISVAGIMTALKNEIIFTDCLTGLYNRVYLEFLHKRACNKKDCWVSGIMIDLNGFKQINDNYGHAEGDLALCIVADLLRKSFSEYGVVTRYAGDEFVIMLNTTDDQLIQKIIKSAKKNFVTENEKSDKPY